MEATTATSTTNQIQNMKYSIHSSKTGEALIKVIDLPQDQVENLSTDNAEGHFRAGSLDELTVAGIDADTSVYALVA